MGRKYNVISDVISEARSDVFIRSFPTLINTPTNVGDGPFVQKEEKPITERINFIHKFDPELDRTCFFLLER